MTILTYPFVRLLHISCVTISGTLFAIRGISTLQGARWPMARGVRYLSYVVDTLLLLAGIRLAVRSGQYPFAAPWLTAKVLWLVLYILLGTFALRRSRTARTRAVFLIAAIAVFLLIISIAMTRNPHGYLQPLFS
jgi:uncharacterized membrane protein SirB2